MMPKMQGMMEPRMKQMMGQGMPKMPMRQEKDMQRGSRLQQAMKRRLVGMRMRRR